MEENTSVEGTSAEIRDPQAVLDALDRAKKDAKQFRIEKEELEKQLLNKDDEIAKFSGKLLREKLNQEIAKLNIQNTDRIIKYLKLQELTFDDDFNIIGLDDQIAEIKQDFPELFDPKLLVGGKADSADQQSVNAKLSASQIQARLVLGR